MKTLFVTFLLGLFTLLFGQTSYESQMKTALVNWDKAETTDELAKSAEELEKISTEFPENWQPKYYAIMAKIVRGFDLNPEPAFAELKVVEEELKLLEEKTENEEVKLLRGLLYTVKVAKNPMQYGMTLSPEIISIYQGVLKQNPNNPRAKYLLAEYNMHSAPYMGLSANQYCPDLEKAIELFNAEKVTDFNPAWGKDRAEQLLQINCK